jgi:DNA polymerase III delta prime subunit
MNAPETTDLLSQTLASGRVHSGYLISGGGSKPRATALRFARALVCAAEASPPCEACSACLRSQEGDPLPLDGKGKKGPYFRHIGDHPDLFWLERGTQDTRIRIDQVRELQRALRLHTVEGGRRVIVIHRAQEMNANAQNALLRLLEEPPALTTLLLVTDNAASLLATIRSRCQRVVLPTPPIPALDAPETPEEIRALAQRLDGLHSAGIPDLLDWAEDFRGARQAAAEELELFLETAARWLRERVESRLEAEATTVVKLELDAFTTLAACRKALVQRNANPQMVAERALLALRGAVAQ